jgi:hypothetical protein
MHVHCDLEVAFGGMCFTEMSTLGLQNTSPHCLLWHREAGSIPGTLLKASGEDQLGKFVSISARQPYAANWKT